MLLDPLFRDRYYKQSRWGNASISYPHIPRYDFHPTGILTVTAGRWPTRTWKDTPRTPLERRLGEIGMGIISLAAEIKVKQQEDARRQDARRRAQEDYEFRKQRLEQERAALKQLESDAASWVRANRVRAYIAAVELLPGIKGELTPERTEWIAWARAKADGIDPLIAVSDPILDAPEPKPPGYLW